MSNARTHSTQVTIMPATRKPPKGSEADWPPPPSDGMYIHWSDGWREQFPESEFAEECENRPRRLWVYKRTAPRMLEDYTLTVAGRVARLDYGGRFADINTKRDWDIGVLKITFETSDRDTVKSLWWYGAKDSFEVDATCSWRPTDLTRSGRFVPPKKGDHRVRAIGEQVLRPGQLRFRRDLMKHYGSRCAVTGCRLTSVLEAAHIMPYRGEEFDHPENGLLLRADIHRLFDTLNLSIDPSTQLVRLSEELLQDPAYNRFDGASLQMSKGTRSPASAALKDHWARFRGTKD